MTTFADRISRLGTETAFAVSAEASAFAAQGHRVYAFHLGDMNIPTPQNIVDATMKAIHDGKTCYCQNAGVPQLREVIAADINGSHGTRYTAENIVIQPGGKPVIGKFIMALMNPGDEVLYPNPGYPIYESQIEFHGGKAVPYTYVEQKDNFALDMDSLRRAITPRTRLLILNDFQNPTGHECSRNELEAIAELALRHDLYVLSDEAYFDIRYSGKSQSLAFLPGMEERSVLLYTFSKKFAMTGWRLGAAVAPKEIAAVIAKLNVNDESCSNHFIQCGAVEGLTGDQGEVKALLATLKERRDAAVDLLNAIKGVRCFRPNATFYLYPNVTGVMTRMNTADYNVFRTNVLKNTGVSFCTRLHFGRPLPGERGNYIRLAYSGINLPEIREGLQKLKEYLDSL
ncbi:MAG: aspartate aminotransferase [Deltaproteobacteria bacterium HGW-Deltaproteobacteria-15]|jgi:aspartate/methionine/tyrosine aminotransferase|nr:MAG: aspartate aminotransferase [Deltaproteobacteria bacterium HGW-Deltaproteobacteria-15]